MEIIDSELLLVEPIDEIFQGFSLSLPDSEKLGVRLRSVEHAYELAHELHTEMLEVTDRPGFQ